MVISYKKATRKIVAFVVAILMYYLIHEGSHLIFALATGTFERINIIFPGIQVQANVLLMTDLQLGIFCLVGGASTLTVAYLFCLLLKKTTTFKSNILRAILYYVTVMFLVADPIYLSILCDVFGGGDMNGIALLMPKIVARIMFGGILLLNLVIIIKFVYPKYKKAFLLNVSKKRHHDNFSH